MSNYGLLGRKLAHSYSPQIHRMLGSYNYTLFEKEPDDLEIFLQSADWKGINVTVPYKKAVIPYLDELSPIAKRLGAVNTVVRRDGRLIGHNTDYFGFQTMVAKTGVHISGKKALVLGSGGASQTACAVLEELGAQVVIISRTGENHYGNLDRHADASVIVNTTPVGMYPHTGIPPVDLNLFPDLDCVLDVIYNPARTQLLLDAEARGIQTQNGLLMLVAQAKEAAQWFTGTTIDNSIIENIHNRLKQQTENIILIGMPGCGKSTIGRALAEQTGKSFADADAEIVKFAGKTIPEIFSHDGEESFRTLETKVLSQLGKNSGMVIATGGGCVTREENYPLLHQNGRIIWLKRNLEQLPTDGRPLSQSNSLNDLYQRRKPLYEQFADYAVCNNGDFSDVLQQITDIMEA